MNGLEIVGAMAIGVFGIFAAWFIYNLAKDAVVCAIFTARVAKVATPSCGAISFAWQLFLFWAKTWLGLNYRPDRMINTATNKVAYWPGAEKTQDHSDDA